LVTLAVDCAVYHREVPHTYLLGEGVLLKDGDSGLFVILPFEEFELAHPFLLHFLVLEEVGLLRVDSVSVLDAESEEGALLEVVLLDEQALHVFDLLRDGAGFALEHKNRVFVEAQVPVLLEALLLVDLNAIVLDPGSVADELRHGFRGFQLPDVVVEALEVRSEDLLVAFYHFIELLDVQAVLVDVQALLLEQECCVAADQHRDVRGDPDLLSYLTEFNSN